MAEQTKKALETDSAVKINDTSGELKSKPNFETADRSPSTGTRSFPRAASTTDINDPSNGLLQKFRSTAGDAYDSATAKATKKLEEQKTNLSSGLSTVADNIRKLGGDLSGSESSDGLTRAAAEVSQTAASKLEKAADYFDRQDLNAMYRDVENLARRNPGLFIGGAFALGFLAARFFKSTSPRKFNTSGQTFGTAPSRQIGANAQTF